ncbi:hypothetical protein SAMN04489761_3401 [Tenacibaculum sp. MAR_2009_124]|nr:hypothetical protein SAMN04489761_3401 [Tenacibaculum sp. MAR_2009_124]
MKWQNINIYREFDLKIYNINSTFYFHISKRLKKSFNTEETKL